MVTASKRAHSAKRQSNSIYDIVVVGGGLAGAAAYCALAKTAHRNGISLALCDMNTDKTNITNIAAASGTAGQDGQDGRDKRVLALGRGGVAILQQWGLWSQLQEHSYPVSSVTFYLPGSGADGSSFVLDARKLGLDAWGWTIPHQRMNSALAQHAKTCSAAGRGLDLHIPFHIDDFELTESGMVLKDQQRGKSLTGHLVLSAEGAKGILADGMRVRRKFLDAEYPTDVAGNYAISAGVELQATEPNSGHWFWDTDGSKGILALVPYRAEKEKIRWTSIFLPSGKQTQIDKDISPAAYTKYLRHFSRGMIRNLESDPLAFSFKPYRTEERLKGPLLLLGDAAQRMTPLGGQAYNLTLWTLEKLRQAFENRLRLGDTHLTEDRSFLHDYIIQTQSNMDTRYRLVRMAADGLARGHPWFAKVPAALLRLPGVGTTLLDLATGDLGIGADA